MLASTSREESERLATHKGKQAQREVETTALRPLLSPPVKIPCPFYQRVQVEDQRSLKPINNFNRLGLVPHERTYLSISPDPVRESGSERSTLITSFRSAICVFVK